ncbi:MAG: hypothetical protein U1A78_05840 [Polyangia bacterium]
MDFVIWDPIRQLAAGAAVRRSQLRRVRGAALVDPLVELQHRLGVKATPSPGSGRFQLVVPAGAELPPGLLQAHDGVARPLDDEVGAALAAAALCGDLERGIAQHARDPELGLALAWAAARAQRDGTPLETILGWLPPELPFEDMLHRAALLRLEVLASAPQLSDEQAQAAVELATGLLQPLAPGPVRERAALALLDLAAAVDTVRLDGLLDAALARLVAAADSAQAALESPPPVDALISRVLSGGDAAELVEELALPYQRFALQHAYLVGALVCRRPRRWPAIESALQQAGAATFPLLPAVFDGIGDLLPACPQPADSPLYEALCAAAVSTAPLLRQAGLAALVLWPSPDERVRYLAGAAAREPVVALRAAVAVALGRAPAATAPALLRLLDDPEPSVRAAAAFSAAGRDLLRAPADPAALDSLAADLRWGSAAVSPAAAAAAACLGLVEPSLGERLLAPLLATVSSSEAQLDGPEWQGLGRFATPRFAFALWASAPAHAPRLYELAVEDNRWLTALGLVLGGELLLVPPPAGAGREELRARALSRLGAETALERIAAAAVLARMAPPGAELLDVLILREPPSLELLQILAELAPHAQVAAERWVAPLVAVLDDGEAPPEARAAAALCLGHLAPPADAAARAALAARAATDDAAYTALGRLLSRV